MWSHDKWFLWGETQFKYSLFQWKMQEKSMSEVKFNICSYMTGLHDSENPGEAWFTISNCFALFAPDPSDYLSYILVRPPMAAPGLSFTYPFACKPRVGMVIYSPGFYILPPTPSTTLPVSSSARSGQRLCCASRILSHANPGEASLLHK